MSLGGFFQSTVAHRVAVVAGAAEAAAYVAAQEATGTTFTQLQKEALTTFVAQMKGVEICPKMRLIYLYLGAGSTQELNLINPAQYPLSFIDGAVIRDSQGIFSNTASGSTGYALSHSGTL